MAGVTWSKEARQDLDAIFLWIENESEIYAKKWIGEVFEKIELVEKFPRMGRTVPEVKIDTIREVFAGKYRIIYNISKNDSIEILTIRHSSKPLSEF